MSLGTLKSSGPRPNVLRYFSYRSISIVGVISFIMSLGLFCIGGYIDSLLFEQSIVEKFPPNFELPYLAKTALVIIVALLLVASILMFSPNTEIQPLWSDIKYKAFLNSSWTHLDTQKADDLTITEILGYGVLLLSYSFLTLFFYAPWSFSALSREDNFLEWCSVLFYLGNCGIFLYLFTHYRSDVQRNSLHCWAALAFGVIFFLIAMEEVSWFQRFLGFETPMAFHANQQSEFNFHNFQTKPIEHLYYFGSFFFLIVLPFTNEHVPLKKYLQALAFFIPSRLILFLSAVFVTYNWQMWNVIFTQISFFITFFIILYYGFAIRQNNKTSFYIVCLFGTLCLTQLIWIMNGDMLVRTYDLTEYKEFFIPLAYLFYSLEILFKSLMPYDPE